MRLSDLNLRPSSSIGPEGSRLIVIVRSREPSVRALVVLEQSQRIYAWDQNLWQIGHALTCGSRERVVSVHPVSTNPVMAEHEAKISERRSTDMIGPLPGAEWGDRVLNGGNWCIRRKGICP